MPEISRFFGIVIAMFYREHPPPHFHAKYGDSEAQIQIDPPAVLNGSLPPRALALVIEWAALHREELLENWERLRTSQQPNKIEGLS